MKNVYADGQFVVMFGGEGGSPTPSEGDPYIVGMGTAYSALPVYSDENDILKIQFKFKNTDETADNKMVIGSAFSGNSDYLLYMTVENGQPIYSYAIANNYSYIKAPRSTTDYDDIELGYDYMKVNGVTYTSSQSSAKHYNHTPIYVFGPAYTGSGVFGEVKIYKNDVLTYDLVPSLNSSDIACFKDVLNSDTEYLSAGTEYYYFKDGGGSSDPIVFKNYAKFDGTGILLPYTINSDYKVSVEFYETEYGTNSCVIGNSYSTGSYYSHLTKYNNNWYASQGTSDYLLTGWTGNVLHKFVNNNGNNQNELDNITMSYTPTTDGSIYYMVGCRESLTGWGYSGYIKSYKIESISTGDAICELKPCLFDNETPCLYDTVNKKFYYANGLTVMDTIPTT